MRPLILISSLILFACNDNKKSIGQSSIDTPQLKSKLTTADTLHLTKNIWTDRLNNNKYPLPDTIGGRPVSFYLENQKVASIAKALYKGQFRPEDNDTTTQLLSLVVTDDSIIRPFYRWCLDFTISISDGALGEYPGTPALKYATKFPQEFFAYMDKDTSGQRYKEWTEIIAYSGLSNYDETNSEIERKIIQDLLTNCKSCNANLKTRISKFAKDVLKATRLQD